MAKAKKNKKISADAVHMKKSATGVGKANPFASIPSLGGKKINPFEVHVNREKFHILGRTCKHDKGLPGVARGKAIKKRKETLGQEYRDKHKSNQFRDRRIGKHLKDDELTEEVINARFVAEKLSQMKQNKTSKFNLNDDEVLTHRGKTLEEVEQFRDVRSDDEDAEDDDLAAEFTEAAHFGGEDGQAKDRKSAIEEMIIEQKRRKVEIAKEKDEVNDLTDKLDSNYKELLGLMGKMSKNELKARPTPDDYDKIAKELIFEPRGVVTDKLLSEEEVAKREKERLEQLEQERLRRMQADGDDTGKTEQPKHRSADELDDGYFAYAEEEEEGTLAYNMDGEVGTRINGENGVDETENANESAEEEESEEEEDSDEEDDSDDDEENNNDDQEKPDNTEEQETDDEESEADNLSDLKMSDSESEADEAKKPVKKSQEKPKKVKEPTSKFDLPFTMDMPANYHAFERLISSHTPEQQGTLIERLIKCHHPKLDGVNREKIVQLFVYLLQYIDDLFANATSENITQQFRVLDKLNPHLYDLVQLNPDRMSATLLSVVKQKHAEYNKNPKMYPPVETVILFKLVSNFYSTSDFRHPIVTPCYVFMQQILSHARVRTRQDIALGLFIVTVALEYAQLSKRFLPAALNFLLGVVYLSIPKRPVELLKIVPPFPNTSPLNKLLTIAQSSAESQATEQLMQAEDLVMQTFTPDFKVRALNMSLRLIKDAITLLGEIVGANYLAATLLDMLERLPLEPYPAYVRQNYDEAVAVLKSVAEKPLKKLVPPEKKPKALRLLEPRIETVYDDKRRPKVSKEKEEKLKLMHKLKRETKGAVREIRRDTEFVQKMRIQQQLQSDLERKEKVKRIYAEAAMQQGELNELARLKKKRKF